MKNPFRYFNSSPEIIRLAVMMYIRYPLSLRQIEDMLFKRGFDICHDTVRYWWNRFGPMFAAQIQKRRVHNHSYSNWRWQPWQELAFKLSKEVAENASKPGFKAGDFIVEVAKMRQENPRNIGLLLQAWKFLERVYP